MTIVEDDLAFSMGVILVEVTLIARAIYKKINSWSLSLTIIN